MNAWRYFNIRPIYEHASVTRRALCGDALAFYAPDVGTAFALARAMWPGAVAWSTL